MSMREWLKRRIKKAGENIESTITNAILVLIAGSYLTILAFSKRAVDFTHQLLTTPTPLWATISLVLLCYVYVYLKFRGVQSSSVPQSVTTDEHKIKYFTVGEQKWKTTIYKNGFFEVDKFPICKKHDLTFIFGHSNGKFYIYCPEVLKKQCNNTIYDSERSTIYDLAKSYIDNQIRNEEY